MTCTLEVPVSAGTEEHNLHGARAEIENSRNVAIKTSLHRGKNA